MRNDVLKTYILSLTSDISMINNISMIKDKNIKASDEIELITTLLRDLEVIGGDAVVEQESRLLKSTHDFIARAHNSKNQYFIEYKKMIPLRKRQLLEKISYQHIVSRRLDHVHNSWIIFLVDQEFDGFIDEIRDFLKENSIDLTVAIISTDKSYCVLNRGRTKQGVLKEKIALLEIEKSRASAIDARRKNKLNFSSNQQWILKYLLLNGMKAEYWRNSTSENLAVSTSLSEATGIVQSACYETLKALENLGYLVPEKNSYRMRNIRQLLKMWSSNYNNNGEVELFALPRDINIKPELIWKYIETNWAEINTKSYNLLFSGTPAFSNYALRISNDFNLIIHTSTERSFLRESLFRDLNLVETTRESSIKILMHKTWKPVLDSSFVLGEHRPSPEFVDILQLAFDSQHFGLRGEEHTIKIFDKILFPFWLKKGWEI